MHFLDVVAVERDDDVAGLDAGRLGWSLVVDACDQRAARGRDVEALADVVGDLLNPHAEPAAARLAVLAQLIDNGDGAVGGNGKADSNRTPRRRDDRGIDADDLAVEVEQRSAGIAAIDRRISLNVVVVGTGIDVAVARGNDACGHRAAEAEWIADGNDPFAQSQLVGIAEFDRLERLVGMHPQQREIALAVLADERGLELGAVVENDADFVRVGDDVIIGDDKAGRIDDEAGTERIDPMRRLIRIVAAAVAVPVLEELVEKLFHRRTGRQVRQLGHVRIDLLRGRNIDDGVDHLLGNVGDVLGSASRCRPGRQDGECRRYGG